MREQELQEFLKELSALSDKYQFVIGGCGCCGSPDVYDEKLNKTVGEHLSYSQSTKKYDMRDY